MCVHVGSVACTWYHVVSFSCLWVLCICGSMPICICASPYLSVILCLHCSVFFLLSVGVAFIFYAQMSFPALYTKGKRSVGRACIFFMSLSRKCFTIERYEWKREWDYFFSFLSLLSTVFCLIFPVMYFLFSPFSPITLQTPVPITNVLNVIYSACTVSPFFTACFLYSNLFFFFLF